MRSGFWKKVRALVMGTAIAVSMTMPAAADIPSNGNVFTITGTGATATIYCGSGQSTVAVLMKGTGTGMNISPQVSLDNVSTDFVAPLGGGVTSYTANGTYSFALQSASYVRFNVSAFTSGSETLIAQCTAAGATPTLNLDGNGNLLVSINALASPNPLPVTTPPPVPQTSPAPQTGSVPPSGGVFEISLGHCIYSTTAVTATSGNMYPIQCNVVGSLNVANTNNVAQGSTTASQVGPLGFCAVASGVQSYTAGQSEPLTCAGGGNLEASIGRSGAGLQATPQCVDNAPVVVNISTAASTFTKLIAKTTGKTVRICNYFLVATGASGTIKFAQGTQTTTACDTSEADLSGPIPLTSTPMILNQGSGLGAVVSDGATGLDFCIQTTGAATTVIGYINYTIY